MNILLCPDKFKGTLAADAVCEALTRGITSALPDANIRCLPLCDGGEGTLHILTRPLGLESITVGIHDPLFRTIKTSYGWNEGSRVAVVEMAKASGLALLQPGEMNCLRTTTLGTGELIADALDRGANEVILTVGGSATHEGGVGMAQALGYRFLNARGEVFLPKGESLSAIKAIDASLKHPRLRDVKFSVLTDVTNPLCGPDGAAFVYALQKGAPLSSLKVLDDGLRHLAGIIKQDLDNDLLAIEGGGAAGGLGGGAVAFLGAALMPGCETVMRLVNFDIALAGADVVVTGEGRLDTQSSFGKVVGSVARKANDAGIPVVAVAGSSEIMGREILQLGLKALFVLASDEASISEAMINPIPMLQELAVSRLSNFLRQIV